MKRSFSSPFPPTLLFSLFIGAVLLALPPQKANAFAYVFAGETNGVDLVTHPLGYSGAGGSLNISVGIDPTSVNAADMMVSVQNVVNTFNGLVPTTGNLAFGTIPGGSPDFESVLLHELGHSLGLAHVNAASESGLAGANQNYTKATDGADNTFNVNPGTDGIIGSADDLRGDDVNLNYFRIADNDPFDTSLGVVDSTTYSRDLVDLPGADTFSANADRTVGAALGYANTEGVMQQGTFFGETQRTLGADDVAGIRYAQTGIDEIQGTGDDYILNLTFAGLDNSADILIDFDNAQTGFAVSISSGAFLQPGHAAITDTAIFFNDGFAWHFNADANSVIPEPSTAFLLVGFFATLFSRYRRIRKISK